MKVIPNPVSELDEDQMMFDPKADIKEAVATDAVIMKDASGNKKWSIQHNTNTVKQDFYSPEPDNKITNGGFETDLSSWTEVISYVLNDQFTTDRAAGAVNGTSAEPTGGTRTVVDTNGKLSITGEKASFAPSGAALGNPGLWYSSQSRVAGKVLLANVNVTATGQILFGWDTNQDGVPQANAIYGTTSLFLYDNNGITSPAIVSPFSIGAHVYASVLRGIG